jgi:hypothetical protein
MEEHVLRRLLYSKVLFLHGSKHAEENTAMDSVFAVLHFDNSIEMLMNTILEYFGAPYKSERRFHELFQDVIKLVKESKDKINADKLLKVREIKNLRLARNNIQHHGIIPAFDEVRRYRILTQGVLENTMSKLFTVPFTEISLGALIKDETVRELYLKADSAFGKAEYKDSLVYCVTAFETAKTKEQMSIYGSGIILRRILSAGKVSEEVEKLLDTMAEELEILKLRLDYKDYQKYRDISYELKPFSRLSSEEELANITKIISERVDKLDKQTLKEYARFCLNFSIESILKWESVSRKGWKRKLKKIEPID